MEYKHRELTNSERRQFRDLFEYNTEHNPLMKRIYKNKWYAAIYPGIIISLFVLSILYVKNGTHRVIGFILGLLSIQLNFIASHVWAHSLMLEYSLWNIDDMNKYVGQIPSVIFFAFYHHHHKVHDDWMAVPFSTKEIGPNLMTAIAHWNSFSLFTMNYPIHTIFMYLFLCTNLYLYTDEIVMYLLGYEIGVFLLPISHDWVHNRVSASYGAYHLLKPLELMGLFATKHDHKRHHQYNGPTVYEGFTSSGLYSKSLDHFVDKIWDKTYHESIKRKVPMYKLLWWFMTVTFLVTFSLSNLIVINLSTTFQYVFLAIITLIVAKSMKERLQI